MSSLFDLIVPQWVALGFTKRQAVHHIVDAHLHSRCARGRGSKAARRAAVAETARWFDELPGLTDDDLRAIYADVGDYAVEARRREHSRSVNFHDA